MNELTLDEESGQVFLRKREGVCVCVHMFCEEDVKIFEG